MVVVAAMAVSWPLIWHPHLEKGFRYWVIYIFPIARVPEFCLGMLIALAVKRGARSRISLWSALVLATAAYVASSLVPIYASWSVVTVVPFALLIFAAASGDLELKPSVVRHRWLIRLGEWSYCFYLFHQLVLKLVTRYLQEHNDLIHHIPRTAPIALAAVAFSFAASVGLSGLIYTIWERPLERRMRGGGPERSTSII
jgi:peptidoglycan/LPS O-acetylase OafA/YrhL